MMLLGGMFNRVFVLINLLKFDPSLAQVLGSSLQSIAFQEESVSTFY